MIDDVELKPGEQVVVKAAPGDPGNGGSGKLTQAEFNAMLTPGLLALPPYPESAKVNGKVDSRDFSFGITHGAAVHARLSEYPFQLIGAQPIDPTNSRTMGTMSIAEAGARGESRSVDSAAFLKAAETVPNGGTVFVPHHPWLISDVEMPGTKDLIIQGESEMGSKLVGAPGRDILKWDDLNVQRRLRLRPIIRNVEFFMPGNGALGNFDRETTEGWKAGAACLAWIQRSQTPDGNRKQAWGNSYLTIQNCTARGEKDAVGATFLWSERAMYGMRVQNLFIGDHGTDVSGLHGGLIMGKTPFPPAEYAPDEFGVDTFVHWGGQVSIAVPNIANGHIRDHKAYACRWPLHLTGLANTGPRRHGRGMYLEGYYDNDVIDTGPMDQEMIHIACDNVTFGVIHLKGSKNGRARPVIEISGKNMRYGIFEIMDSAAHQAPRFKISGGGHQFAVDAGGVSDSEKRTMFNGSASYPGVTVL